MKSSAGSTRSEMGRVERDGTPIVSETPAAHPIRQSLVRPMLYAGVERVVIALEATVCLGLLLGAGPRLPTLGVCAAIVMILHPTMAWLTAKDSLATEIYVRSRAYRDFYAPQPAARRGGRSPRPSVPRIT